MASRLRTPLTCLSLLAVLAACDDSSGPERARIEDLELEVVVPELVQAGDPFAVEVRFRNTSSNATGRPLMLEFCGAGENTLLCDGEAVVVGEIESLAGDGRDTVTFAAALDPAHVGLGGARMTVACLRDAEAPSSAWCNGTPIVVNPDLEALCEPAIATLPLSANTDDHLCSIDGQALTVLAVDAVPGFDYRFESTNAIGWSVELFDETGAVIWNLGSTPDGNFFFVETAGTVYVVVEPMQQAFDFTLDAVATSP